MAEENFTGFVVEALRTEPINSVELVTVVLAPAKGNKIFKGNSVARLEITRLEKRVAENFKVGSNVDVEIST